MARDSLKDAAVWGCKPTSVKGASFGPGAGPTGHPLASPAVVGRCCGRAMRGSGRYLGLLRIRDMCGEVMTGATRADSGAWMFGSHEWGSFSRVDDTRAFERWTLESDCENFDAVGRACFPAELTLVLKTHISRCGTD